MKERRPVALFLILLSSSPYPVILGPLFPTPPHPQLPSPLWVAAAASGLVGPHPLWPAYNLVSTLQTNANPVSQLLRSFQSPPIVLRVEIRFPSGAYQAPPTWPPISPASFPVTHLLFSLLQRPALPPSPVTPQLPTTCLGTCSALASSSSHPFLLEGTPLPLSLCFISTGREAFLTRLAAPSPRLSASKRSLSQLAGPFD